MIATEANQHEITSLSNSAQVMASRICEKRSGLKTDYLALGEVLFKLRELLPDGVWGFRLNALGIDMKLAQMCIDRHKKHVGNTERAKHAMPGNQNAARTVQLSPKLSGQDVVRCSGTPQPRATETPGVVALRGGVYFPVIKNIDGHDVWADTGVRLDLDEICSQVAEAKADAIMNREAGHVDGPDGVVGRPDDSHDPDGDSWEDGAESDEAGEGEIADGDGEEDHGQDAHATPSEAASQGQAPGVRAVELVVGVPDVQVTHVYRPVGVPVKAPQLMLAGVYEQAKSINRFMFDEAEPAELRAEFVARATAMLAEMRAGVGS